MPGLGDVEAAIEKESASKPHHVDPLYRNAPFFAGLDWFLRPWRYFDSSLSAVRYMIAACAFYGGFCFLIGAVCGITPQIADKYVGGFDAYAWSTIFTFFIGSYLFTTGCFLLSVEAMNRNHPDEMAEWKAGQRPTKPKFRYLWIEPKNLGWWGGVSYTFGALLYNIGTTATFATCFDGVVFSEKMIKYWEFLPFLLGGPFFALSGILYCIEFTGLNLFKGILPIPALVGKDIKTFTWWVNMCNFYGGILFCASGFIGYNYYSISLLAWRIQNVIGFGVGAVMFSTAGCLLFVQSSLARCCGSPAPLADAGKSGEDGSVAPAEAAGPEPSVASSYSSQVQLLK